MDPTPSFCMLSISLTPMEKIRGPNFPLASATWVYAAEPPEDALARIGAASPFLGLGASGIPARPSDPSAYPECLAEAARAKASLHLQRLRSDADERGRWGVDFCLEVVIPALMPTPLSLDLAKRGGSRRAMGLIRPAAEALLPEWGRALGLGEPVMREDCQDNKALLKRTGCPLPLLEHLEVGRVFALLERREIGSASAAPGSAAPRRGL